MFREVKHPISDRRIPAGYEVTYHENRGYDSPDRWYEAREGRRKIGINFGRKDDAIEACVEDAKKRRWQETRYDKIMAEDAPEEPPQVCAKCGKSRHEDDSKVTWRCSVCESTVCRDCTLTIPGSCPLEYFERTLCSHACWITAGRPDE